MSDGSLIEHAGESGVVRADLGLAEVATFACTLTNGADGLRK
jgi:hypothetical protein